MKLQQARHYNKNARDLPKLNIGDTVYVQLKPNIRKLTPGIIFHTGLENSRTYSVQTIQGGQYVRDRKFFQSKAHKQSTMYNTKCEVCTSVLSTNMTKHRYKTKMHNKKTTKDN